MNPDDFLYMYSIYENPRDYPGQFVARKWVISCSPVPIATGDVYQGASLDEVRKQLPPGLNCLPRGANDDRCIVETWL